MCHHCDTAKKEAKEKGEKKVHCQCCASEWKYEDGFWLVVNQGIVGYCGA